MASYVGPEEISKSSFVREEQDQSWCEWLNPVTENGGMVLFFFLSFFFFFAHFYFPASGQAVVTGVVPSAPRFLRSFFYRA